MFPPPKALYAHLSHACYVPRQSDCSRLDHSDYMWWWVQVTKLLNTQSCPAFYNFIPPRCIYFPSILVTKPLRLRSSLSARPTVTPIQNYTKNYSFVYSLFLVSSKNTLLCIITSRLLCVSVDAAHYNKEMHTNIHITCVHQTVVL
jgi:hypothetical protein